MKMMDQEESENQQMLEDYLEGKDQNQECNNVNLQFIMVNNIITRPTLTMSRNITTKINESDIKYKNFPKMIGNNIVKWSKTKKYFKKQQNIPKGIQSLIELRNKDNQSKIKIKDLRDSIIDDVESQNVFIEYISDQLFLDIIFSNKIANPFSYVPGISNYYSAALEPENMKGNYFMRKHFIDNENQ